MDFQIVGGITQVEVIAVGAGIRDLGWLRRQYGAGRWRTMQGMVRIRLPNDHVRSAELHWYEAHGIGRVKTKFNRFRD